MYFADTLNTLIMDLDYNSKQIADYCGLSNASLSRYRTGNRIPPVDSKQIDMLVNGLIKAAEDSGRKDWYSVQELKDILIKAIHTDLGDEDMALIVEKLNTLMTEFHIQNKTLAQYLNYDPSFLSKVRSGERKFSNIDSVITNVAKYVTGIVIEEDNTLELAELMNVPQSSLQSEKQIEEQLILWMNNSDKPSYDSEFSSFLKNLDTFNLEDYIRSIHFDTMKVPTAPIHIQTSKMFMGIEEFKDCELLFLKTTAMSKGVDKVIMYSDMPIEVMSQDVLFAKKWIYGMAALLKKGYTLQVIHNVDRPINEMLLGLEMYIPMYMTGQLEPYYFDKIQGTVFNTMLKYSSAAAVSGEAISGFHEHGQYYYTTKKSELEYYNMRAKDMLSKAKPLLEIYNSNRKSEYRRKLRSITAEGNLKAIRSSLPLYTIDNDLLDKILSHSELSMAERDLIRRYMTSEKNRVSKLLKKFDIECVVPIISEEEFKEYPMSLSISGLFLDKNIQYRYDEYLQHLESTKAFAEENKNYHLSEKKDTLFKNIQILISRGKCVIVSKNTSPAIQFIINHPKMVAAIEKLDMSVLSK